MSRDTRIVRRRIGGVAGPPSSLPPLSAPGTSAEYYDDDRKEMMLSVDGGPYLPYATAGPSGLLAGSQFGADQLQNPVTADWAINALAPAAPDSNNDGLTVRLFDDGIEEGIGFALLVPQAATEMALTVVGRAEVAPGGAEGVVLSLYERGIPDNAITEAWSARIDLLPIAIPANEFFQYDTDLRALAAWGVTAGQLHQFELTRNVGSAGDTLTGDWALLELRVDFD